MNRRPIFALLVLMAFGSARSEVLFDTTGIQSNAAFGLSHDLYSGNSDYTVGQAFMTGASAYRLDQATLLFDIHATGPDASPVTEMELQVFTDNAGLWDQPVGTLISPALNASDTGSKLYDFNGNGILLAPNSKYWLVARNLQGMVFWMATTTAGETVNYIPPHQTGQLVQNDLQMTMRVEATAVPEPGTLAAVGLGAVVFLRRRRS